MRTGLVIGATDILRVLNRPRIKVFGAARPAFQVLGLIGVAAAAILSLALTRHSQLSLAVEGSIILSAVATFLALVMATKIVTGREAITYYHHEIAVMLTTAGLLWLIRRPVLPYLDVTIVGIGVFLAFGRIGCFMVGCCHGRPVRTGVCYLQEHVDVGFSAYLAGMPLFPVQLMESVWALLISLAGSALIWNHRPPGSALAWYVISYDTGRFFFEFMRGDAERPYYLGFSQPQWISVILIACVGLAEAAGLLPYRAWHIAAAAGMGLLMIGVPLARKLRKTPTHLLLHPRHIRELAGAIRATSASVADESDGIPWTVYPQSPRRQQIHVASTSLGIRISAGQIGNGADALRHISVSQKDGPLSEETMKVLTDVLLSLAHLDGMPRTLNGGHGVFHVLAAAPPAGQSPAPQTDSLRYIATR